MIDYYFVNSNPVLALEGMYGVRESVSTGEFRNLFVGLGVELRRDIQKYMSVALFGEKDYEHYMRKSEKMFDQRLSILNSPFGDIIKYHCRLIRKSKKGDRPLLIVAEGIVEPQIVKLVGDGAIRSAGPSTSRKRAGV